MMKYSNTAKHSLVIRVHSIKGTCPVYKVGDTFYIKNGYKLKTDRPICMHALSSLMPYYVALSRGISPKELGLGKDDNACYVQCLDPCEYTDGGTVIFKITKINNPSKRFKRTKRFMRIKRSKRSKRH